MSDEKLLMNMPEFKQAFFQFIEAYVMVAQQQAKNYNEDGFTFIKSDIETDNGGLYLLQLVHIRGPKIPMLKPKQNPPKEGE